MPKYINKNRGFTLIELLVVVAIIGLLSAVVLGSIKDSRNKANDKALLSSAIQLRNALELYKADYGGYPGEATGGVYYGNRSTTGVFTVSNSGGIDLAVSLAPYLSGNIVDPIYPNSYYYYYVSSPFVQCEGWKWC